MILDLELKKDPQTNKIISEVAASYDPPQDVRDRTAQILRDYQYSYTIRNRAYREFNDCSVIQRMSQDQRSWNEFVEASSSDPSEAWRSRAFRPIVRNKIISIAAHVTASILYPKVYAQNEESYEDQAAASVMRDLIEWAGEQSDYEKTFLYSIISALVNPACIVNTEYTEVRRKVKEMQEDGSYTIKEILDEAFSGFKDSIVPVDELYIADIYEHDIQKQPYLIWRRVIPFTTAREKYADETKYPRFKYVQPGLQFLYNDDNNMFYQVYDQSLRDNLVEEIKYYNRTGDLELVFVNGVLITDVDRPNPRQDKKYPFVKTGYELIDEGRFFYYKSLAFKLAPDEEVVNTLYRMMADGTYIQTMPPAVVFGNEEIGSSVVVPGAVTTIDNSTNPNASFQTINTNNNLTAAGNMLDRVERSMAESSSDVLQSGQAPSGSQTAFEIGRLEQNARIMLGLFGKMIGFFVKEWGELRVSDILQFMTVGDLRQIEDSEDDQLQYRTFLLSERTVDGKTKAKRIEFDANLPDEMTGEEEMQRSLDIYQKELDLDEKLKIYKVNPTLFRELKYKCMISPEPLYPKSDALKKALYLEEYALAIANPLADKEAVTRDLLFGAFDKTKDNPDEYMMDEEQQQQQQMQQMGAQPKGPSNPANLAQESPNTSTLLKNQL